MSTNGQPPPLLLHLDAAERAGAALADALLATMAVIPDGDAYNGARYEIGKLIEHTKNAGCLSGARASLAEASRVKGPMVEICYPKIRGSVVQHASEIAEITGSAIVLRSGERYSRRNGRKIGGADRWHGAPYITEAERARVLALPRPPAPARPRAPKEPRP